MTFDVAEGEAKTGSMVGGCGEGCVRVQTTFTAFYKRAIHELPVQKHAGFYKPQLWRLPARQIFPFSSHTEDSPTSSKYS